MWKELQRRLNGDNQRRRKEEVIICGDTQGRRRMFTRLLKWEIQCKSHNMISCATLQGSRTVSLQSCIQPMTPILVIPNKLLLLKVDCCRHDESSEQPETHQASRNPIRTKTNMWSSKLSLHHHPISQTRTSVWNTSWWLNKQIPTFLVFGFWGAD